jgi:uncharacterized protein YxeA
MKKIIFILVTFFLVIVILELGTRLMIRCANYIDICPFLKIYDGKPYVTYALDENGSPIWVNGYQSYQQRGEDSQYRILDAQGFNPSDSKTFGERGIKIGIFGDSYTQGMQLPEEKTFPKLLEKKLREQFPGKKIFVYNFGIGGTGTYQEYLRYLTVKKEVRLDYVVLAFLPLNDVINNHCILGRPYELPNSRYLKYKGGKFIEMQGEAKNNFFILSLRRVVTWVQYRSYFVSLLLKLEVKIKQMILANQKIKEAETRPAGDYNSADVYIYSKGGGRYAWLGVFGEPPNEDWSNAWKITEESIYRMKAAAEKQETRFLLLLLTDSIQVDTSQIEENQRYDFEYPNRRLRIFAQKELISYVDTYNQFLERKKNLKFPYFSWKYDGHYSEVGTEFTSDILKEYILSDPRFKLLVELTP